MLSNLVGLIDFYKVTGKKEYLLAIENAWKDIIENQLYLHGTCSYAEHFVENKKLRPKGHYAYGPTFTAPGEGCVTVTWLQMNIRLLQLTGELKYMEQIENTVYNALLGAQNPKNGKVCYFVPLMGRKRYREVSQAIEPDICCCASSIPRGISMIPDLIGGNLDKKTLIMLLTESEINTNFYHNKSEIPVKLKIHTDFPVSGKAKVKIESENDAIPKSTILFRVPEWADSYTVLVHNKKYVGEPGTFLEIERTWKNNDSLLIDFQMPIKMVNDNKNGSDMKAFKRGPQLLASDENVEDIKELPQWGWLGTQLYKVLVQENGFLSELLLVPFADAGQSMADYKVLFSDVNLAD